MSAEACGWATAMLARTLAVPVLNETATDSAGSMSTPFSKALRLAGLGTELDTCRLAIFGTGLSSSIRSSGPEACSSTSHISSTVS